MQEFPVKIDALLEPLLTVTTDEDADEVLSQVIAEHAEPVIKGVIRFKLRFNSHHEMQRAEANDEGRKARSCRCANSVVATIAVCCAVNGSAT